MKRLIGAVLAMAVAAGALAPATASARDYYGRGGHYSSYGHRGGHGDAVAAGVVGLALGAVIGSAITNDNHRNYDRGYGGGGYYRDGYYGGGGGYREGYYGGGGGYEDRGYYGRGPELCIVREHTYDRWGRPIVIEDRRPC